MRRSPALALAALATLCACEELGPEIDPFPIPANRVNGPLRVGLVAGVDAPIVALLDTNAPLTVVDRGAAAPRRRRTDVTVLAACSGDNPLAGCVNAERVRYTQVPVVEAHPCELQGQACRIGLEPLADASAPEDAACGDTAGPDTVGYAAILGTDLLSMSALRLDLRDADAPAVRLFPDIAGDRRFYCEADVAVLPTPFAGGATISIEGGDVIYVANRIALNACADFAVDEDAEASGAALLLLLSTGVGPTVLSRSAYDRYALRTKELCDRPAIDGVARCGDAPEQVSAPIDYADLPEQCLQLPSGPTVARIATLRRLAITGNTARARGPCEERRAARIMSTDGACASAEGCPCENNETRCVADAAVDLEPVGGIEVAVLPDTHPLLQGLRDELRPGLAEIDGLLGLDALHALTLDIDYPGARVLVDCEPPDDTGHAACTAYTETVNSTGATAAERCR